MTDKHTPDPTALFWADIFDKSMMVGAENLASELRRLHAVENQINQLTKQRDDLLAALKDAVTVAKSACECWNKYQDTKVGKYLIALAGGLPGYDKRTDEIHAAIAAVKDKK